MTRWNRICKRWGILGSSVCLILMSGAQPTKGADEADRLECVSKQNAASLPSNEFAKFTDAQLEKLSTYADSAIERAATRTLAERYERGVDGHPNFTKALELYRKAAFVQPPVRGIYTPGFGNVRGTVTMTGADAPVTVGDSTALARLGELYRDGLIVARDPDRAQVFLDCSAKLSMGSAVGAMSKESSYFDQFTKPSPTPAPHADSVLLDRKATSLSFSSDVTGMAWSPDGNYLAVYYDRGDRLDFVRVADRRRLWTVEKDWGITAPKERVIHFSSSGKSLYLSAPLGKLRRAPGQLEAFATVSTIDGHVAHVVPAQPSARAIAHVLALAVDSTSGKLFAVNGGSPSKIVTYDPENWKHNEFFGLPDELPEWGYGFTSSRLALDSARGFLWWAHEGTLELVKSSDAKALGQLHAFSVVVQAIQVNPRSGELVAGGSADFYSYRYPLTDPKAEIRSYHDDPVTLVRAFDPVSGKQARVYPGPGGSVEGLSVSADGRFVAAAKARMMGVSSSYVLLWDAESGRLLSSKDCGSSSVGDIAFDPTGTKLAYAVNNKINVINLSR